MGEERERERKKWTGGSGGEGERGKKSLRQRHTSWQERVGVLTGIDKVSPLVDLAPGSWRDQHGSQLCRQSEVSGLHTHRQRYSGSSNGGTQNHVRHLARERMYKRAKLEKKNVTKNSNVTEYQSMYIQKGKILTVT